MGLEDNIGIISLIDSKQSEDEYKKLHWKGTFSEYLDLVRNNPKVTRNAFQRLYDMIMSFGSEEYEDIKKKLVHYKFFDDQLGNGEDAIFGLDLPLMKLVSVLRSAAEGYNTRKRVLLLHGPVGSSKSTIARLLKKNLENYSRTDAGVLYTFHWDAEIDGKQERSDCPMHEEPLKIIPLDMRPEAFAKLSDKSFKITVEGHLCPPCRFIYQKLSDKYNGKFSEISKHVKVKRFLLSEKDRKGIGTFQPKDEKNQDSTELTGDINYRKIAEYGSESDPRAFNFDGEFNIANRGIIEFIEVLKLDVAFLYDLLGASQEHSIKPKRFAQTSIDEVILGHTNEPEFKKLEQNEFMEALRDRTIKVDIPYITKWPEEVRIYNKDYGPSKINKHIAPHTLEMAAMWAVLTRLEEPTKYDLSILQKMHMYAGKKIQGFTEDHVKELRKMATKEGMGGISPRYVQDKLSSAIVTSKASDCLNPFLVLNELEAGLRSHTLIRSQTDKEKYTNLIKAVKQEYEDLVKRDVQLAISADSEALEKLCGNYIDNVKAFTQKEKIKNKYTGLDEEPDTKLMRTIEEKIEVPESRAAGFRQEIMNYIGALAVDGKKFNFKSNERLLKALELKLFEDQKDTIKLSTLVSNVMDKETQQKIDVIKQRMMKNAGYCDVCATDVLNFVASIFARGQAK